MHQSLLTFLLLLPLLLISPDAKAQRVETIQFASSQTVDGLYVNAAGQLFAMGGFASDRVYRVDPSGTLEVFATGFDGPVSMTQTPDGAYYATEFRWQFAEGGVARVDANGVAQRIATVLAGPADIVADDEGMLYVTHF